MERTLVAERNLAETSKESREVYASTIASAAIGIGFASIVPLARLSFEDMEIRPMELAGVMVASIIVGAGLCLHLSWVAKRMGMWRFRAMMLVLGGFAVDAIGTVAFREQFLAMQFVAGVILAALFAVQMRLREPSQSNTPSGLAAGMGIVATVFGAPLVFQMGMSAGLGMPGSWRTTNALSAVLLIAAAGVSYVLTRPATVKRVVTEREIAAESDLGAIGAPELAAA